MPSRSDKNPAIKSLYSWVDNQKYNYKNNIGIMKDNIVIRGIWESFVAEYRTCFYTTSDNETLKSKLVNL